LRFARYGRTHQLRIETAEDLEAVLALDESLWVATGAPCDAFRCDRQFLTLVDTDHNDRIYTNELKDAIRWLLERLADHSRIAEGTDALSLSAVRNDTPEGEALVRSARYVLAVLGEGNAEAISLGQIRGFLADVQSRPLNGDGVVVPEAAADPPVAELIKDIVACLGGTDDVSGQKGITEAQLKQFFEAVRGHLDWRDQLRAAAETDAELLPLGEQTAAAHDVYQTHAEKVDTFFARCRVWQFDPRAAEHLDWPQTELQKLDAADLAQLQSALQEAPLARPNPEGRLPLSEDAVNPFYRSWIAALKEKVLRPILGRVPEQLSEDDWARTKSTLAPYAAYLKAKPGAEVEPLGLEKLQAYRDGALEPKILELIEKDRHVADVLKDVRQVEQLLLYHQHLMRLANNFVSFPDLYTTGRRALFERGSVVIDGRWFNFAVRIEDLAAHRATTKDSNIFTLYLEVTRAAGEKFHLAVPVTSGTKSNLGIGKHGVFFDTDGQEYDVRVVQVIENPTSLREALVRPFVSLGRFVTGKIEAFSAKGEKGLEKGLDTSLAAPKGAGGMAGGPAGLMVGVSFAVAALGSAFAFIVKTLAGLQFYQVALGLGGLALAVMVPLGLVAQMRLRRQDLSTLLEGCGWAINARMRMDRKQRKHFTNRGSYPKDAEGTPQKRWVKVVLVLLALAALALGVYFAIQLLSSPSTPTAAKVVKSPG